MKKADLVGEVFSRLIVQRYLGSRNRNGIWLCVCECGGTAEVSTTHLRSGHTQSCGCLHREATADAHSTHGCARPGRVTAEYKTWLHMKDRCQNSNNNRFHRYGGRGIMVCERWNNSFEAFLEDMGTKPTGKSIERDNNDGNYEPGNCRWATAKEQANNRQKRSAATGA